MKTTSDDPPTSQSVIPKEAWAFSGYATPEAALQTWAWAMRSGNLPILLDSLTAEAQTEFNKPFAGKTENEIKASLQAEINQISGLRLDRRKILDDGRVAFTLFAKEQDSGMERMRDEAVVTFKKIGDLWKMEP